MNYINTLVKSEPGDASVMEGFAEWRASPKGLPMPWYLALESRFSIENEQQSNT